MPQDAGVAEAQARGEGGVSRRHTCREMDARAAEAQAKGGECKQCVGTTECIAHSV